MLNAELRRRDVMVLGASAGGVEALTALFAKLPPDFDAIVLAVIHRRPFHGHRLGSVLGRRAAEPGTGDPVRPGVIQIAPRDQHMVVERGRIPLNRGAKQHHTWPAVDPLFASAAAEYGPRVVGVLLSGGGDDGVTGLMAIKRAGGISIAQDPSEATHASMPLSAILHDHVDAVLPIAEIASTLVALAAGETTAVA